jgi:hypothetical protein
MEDRIVTLVAKTQEHQEVVEAKNEKQRNQIDNLTASINVVKRTFSRP